MKPEQNSEAREDAAPSSAPDKTARRASKPHVSPNAVQVTLSTLFSGPLVGFTTESHSQLTFPKL